jgi:hypothetical protein
MNKIAIALLLVFAGCGMNKNSIESNKIDTLRKIAFCLCISEHPVNNDSSSYITNDSSSYIYNDYSFVALFNTLDGVDSNLLDLRDSVRLMVKGYSNILISYLPDNRNANSVTLDCLNLYNDKKMKSFIKRYAKSHKMKSDSP